MVQIVKKDQKLKLRGGGCFEASDYSVLTSILTLDLTSHTLVTGRKRSKYTSCLLVWVLFFGKATPCWGVIGGVWKNAAMANDKILRELVCNTFFSTAFFSSLTNFFHTLCPVYLTLFQTGFIPKFEKKIVSKKEVRNEINVVGSTVCKA